MSDEQEKIMSITKLSVAIQEATEEHGEWSLWSDGGTTWTLDNYLDAHRAAWQACCDADCDGGTACDDFLLDPLAYYDGWAIYGYRADTIDFTAPLLRIEEA